MAEIQRTKNDRATIERRDVEDNLLRDNRNKNDVLTEERRLKADKTLNESRVRNDETTAQRRNIKDRRFQGVLTISLLIVIVLAAGIILVLK